MKYWSKHVFTSFASIFLPGAVFFPKVIVNVKVIFISPETFSISKDEFKSAAETAKLFRSFALRNTVVFAFVGKLKNICNSNNLLIFFFII